jgi:hypothetical protein
VQLRKRGSYFTQDEAFAYQTSNVTSVLGTRRVLRILKSVGRLASRDVPRQAFLIATG